MNETLTQLMNQSPLVQGGMTLMIAGWLGYQLRTLPGRVMDLFRENATRQVQIRDTHPHYEAWLAMLTEHAVRPGGPRTLEVRVSRDADGVCVNGAALTAGVADFWARVHGHWCHVSVHREDRTSTMNFMPRYMITAEVFMCSREDLGRITDEAARRATTVENRQLVDFYSRHGCRSTVKIPKRTPETLCLPKGLFESVERQLRDFCGSRERYERAGLPWRQGVLLSGPPGTGKTSFAHALASKLGLRIAVITLADLESDTELVETFRSIEDQAIILIEDVDCAFRMRDGESAAGISFSGFLNCIDGVMAPHNGRILVMSTNHVDRLDPALVRPGRVDLHVEVPALSRQAAMDYVDRVFPHVPTRHAIVDEVMTLDCPTPAVLINRLTHRRWNWKEEGLVSEGVKLGARFVIKDGDKADD